MLHRCARCLAALLFLPASVAAKGSDKPIAVVTSAAPAPGIIAMGGEFIGGLKLGEQSFTRRGRGGFVAAQARDGRILWARVFAAATSARVSSVAIRANGEIAVGGGVGSAPVDFGGGTTLPQGRSDGFVARYDPRGGARTCGELAGVHRRGGTRPVRPGSEDRVAK